MGGLSVINEMAYTCTSCDGEFQSAAAVNQHVALHHNECGLCGEGFDDVDGLREHTHATH